MVKTNGRKTHLWVALGCMALGASILWAGPGTPTALNKLVPLGNEFAPDAWGEATYNPSGATLNVSLTAANLVAGKEYTLKCCDIPLGNAVAGESGTVVVAANVTNGETLKTISDNPKRKFFLWQECHCLAWSNSVFDFTYTP